MYLACLVTPVSEPQLRRSPAAARPQPGRSPAPRLGYGQPGLRRLKARKYSGAQQTEPIQLLCRKTAQPNNAQERENLRVN